MYIVTGGAGFIGSAMVWKLNTLGLTDILVVDELDTSEKWKNLVNLRYSAYMHKDDFLKAILKNTITEPIEAIYHMGACSDTTELDADYLMRNNLEYSKALCLYAKNKNIRFINASSASTYGDGEQGFDDTNIDIFTFRPLNMYGYSKHLFDLWAEKNGYFDSVVSLKFFNVYGPNEQHKENMRSVVNKAFHQVNETGAITLFKSTVPDYADGGQMRDFLYIKDCVAIMWWLTENRTANGIFNVGTGTARSWNHLAAAVFSAMNMPANITYVDMPKSLREKYQNFTEARMERLRIAGYTEPIYTLEQGVAEYIRYYLAAPNPYL